MNESPCRRFRGNQVRRGPDRGAALPEIGGRSGLTIPPDAAFDQRRGGLVQTVILNSDGTERFDTAIRRPNDRDVDDPRREVRRENRPKIRLSALECAAAWPRPREKESRVFVGFAIVRNRHFGDELRSRWLDCSIRTTLSTCCEISTRHVRPSGAVGSNLEGRVAWCVGQSVAVGVAEEPVAAECPRAAGGPVFRCVPPVAEAV